MKGNPDPIGENDAELQRIRKKKMLKLMDRREPRNSQGQKADWPSAPITVTDKTFAEIIQKYPLVVIDCWAPWCGPCRVVGPVIEALARDYRGKIVFGKLNVDENRSATMNYNIMSIPTLLIFKNSKLVDQIVGALPRQMLEPRLQSICEAKEYD